MTGKRIALSLLLILAVGSAALAQTQYGSLESLVGDVLFFYEWPASEGVSRTLAKIGAGGRSTGFEGWSDLRLTLGRDGVVLRRSNEVMYLAPSQATDIELVQVDSAALDAFRARAVWRFVAEHDREAAVYPNFRYTVRGTTATVTADEVLVTPEHLVVVTSSGQWVNIFSRNVVGRMTLLSTPKGESQAAARDLTQFESTRPFRGLKWGDPPSVLGAVQLVRQDSYKDLPVMTYTRPWEDLNLGGGFLASSIEYAFLDSKLVSIAILMSEEVDIDNARPELRELVAGYDVAMANATHDDERRLVQDKYVWDLYRALESQISEEWGGMRLGGGLGSTQWRQGTDAALLTRDWSSMSFPQQTYFVLADQSVQ